MSELVGYSNIIPPDEVLGFTANLLVWWEVKITRPVDNLSVGVVRLLGAEWWPADQALKHDGADTPPIAAVVVTLTSKDFGGNVIGGTNGRVGKLTT